MLYKGLITDCYLHTGYSADGVILMTSYHAQLDNPNRYDHATVSLSKEEAKKLAAELSKYAKDKRKN